ncbi:bifunctional tetrahydrofolate synthase/dihydrofolate synthase [Pseudoxanthomonas dokdonensis]|uniref:Dihydrofolate synthase/folylpolyglutamate synthase n=1 Tax=Pseudoxanthomonas dokdonensis TaxID=344882 RepID=A0A0R0CP55_9GAMM|nr:bifunctional tetrahydrofolate synthase/dihydrofolate synthase [Pseudoxanthomonas dokdonensis]KRG68178.1 folylpolyglutamate synthase [Pseudoxanthomonas dokdonensis]
MARTLSEWLAYIEGQHPRDIEMGLERVRQVADALQLPRPANHVISVAGTNGKGSTVAFIEAIARAAGYRVGSYTSPHLLRYNERVRMDGEEVDDHALVQAFEAVEAARGDTALTYFEFGTLAALWLFARQPLDLAVLEIGLGGRLDAVNLVDPDVAVITTVDIDHVDWLGPDRESIGREKAGIARAWKPLVLGEVDAPSSVLAHAYQIGAGVIQQGNDFFHERIDSQHWRWREVGSELTLPYPMLAAPVQLANAATAIAALHALPLDIDAHAFADGVATARIAGRLQALQRDGVDIVLDVGHNPQAAGELARWLRQQSPRRWHVLLAVLADKDAAGVVEAFDGIALDWQLAGLLPGQPRGQSAQALATRLAGTAAGDAEQHASVAEALAALRRRAGTGDGILVLGSFHTVAEALLVLHSGQ